MSTTVVSAAVYGFQANVVEVEVDLGRGLPQFHIVGLGDTAIQESKERIRSAIKNSHREFHDGRITVNLAPASSKKEGASLDCAIAVGMLCEQDAIPSIPPETLIIGELALDGSVRPVQGVIHMALLARQHHISTMIVPEKNLQEVQVIEGLTYIAVRQLNDVVAALVSDPSVERIEGSRSYLQSREIPHEAGTLLEEIHGHAAAKRALMIAAAGNHHVLFYGPPGSGKSLLAQSLSTMLPEMTEQEMIEATQVHSIAGTLSPEFPLITARPFRAPHHSATSAAILGGGTPPRPGEISLAHHGVLFFDELLEFRRDVIEALRQPLERKFISISRSQYHCTYPSNFLFVGTLNPCPCGYATDPDHECVCTSQQRLLYLKRLSGPVKDRCDLFVHVERQSLESTHEPSITSNDARAIVTAARVRQQERFAHEPYAVNGDMTYRFIRDHLAITPQARKTLRAAETRLHLSPRAYIKLIRTSQTIADLANASSMEESYVLEALQFRHTERL